MRLRFAIFFAALILVSACSQKKSANNTLADVVDSTSVATTLAIEHFCYTDSSKYAYVNIEIELPKTDDEVAAKIRCSLMDLVGERLSHVTSYESERSYPLYSGKSEDDNERLNYYFKQTMLLMDKQSLNDANERIHYIKEDSTLTAEEKASSIESIPHWAYEYKLVKTADTLGYVVFLSQDYIYMGGAHGGVGGDGFITYDKHKGCAIRQFVDTTRVADMQPLFIEGLKQYYSDAEQSETMTTDALFERLQLPFDGPKNQIPLPVGLPCPTPEGLSFIYGQYEIACYADGMPSFVIPYHKLKPFLTEEAAQLLKPYLE